MKEESFEIYLNEQLENPDFRAKYEAELEVIRQIDRLVNELDAVRIQSEVSKERLANSLDVSGAQIRRLFSNPERNPTMKSFLAIASALGLEVQLVSSSATERISP